MYIKNILDIITHVKYNFLRRRMMNYLIFIYIYDFVLYIYTSILYILPQIHYSFGEYDISYSSYEVRTSVGIIMSMISYDIKIKKNKF